MFEERYQPTEFDILVTDVSKEDLNLEISQELGRTYLSTATEESTNGVNGIVWGPYNRVFVVMVVKIKDKKKYVHFLVNTGSPRTYICQQVFESFNKTILHPSNKTILHPSTPVSLHINDKQLSVLQSPASSHFNDINILGTDYMRTFNVKVCIDFKVDHVELTTQE